MRRAAHPALLGAAASGALLLVLGSSGAAFAADPPCSSLPQPIYGIGGSSMKPIFAKLGKALSGANPPETIVYQAPGGCFGPSTISTPDAKITGTASYWGVDGKEVTCVLPDLGQVPDFGAGGNYVDKCPDFGGLPADVGDFLGPVQSFVFIANKGSNETSISAAAAYFIYGFGAAGQASPWIDEAAIIKRDANSAAAIAIALAINVPVGKLKGVDAKTNGNSVKLVSESVNLQGAIGFVSGEVADASADKVNVLGYQHYDQTCAFWPSTTPTSFDRKNVRDGHYAIWANVHFFAKIDGSGKPTSPAAKRLLGYYDGTVAPPAGVDVLKSEIDAGAVPDCAMRVKRTSDLGPLASYAPAEPCSCFYDLVATGATDCTPCQNDGQCSAGSPVCRHGYCEVN